MKILVLNCGSSSLKFQLIDMTNEERVVKGNYERIGGMKSALRLNVRGNKETIIHVARDYDEAIRFVLQVLMDEKYQIISSLDEISAIGHRIVHGGEKFSQSVVITEEVIEKIEECTDLAPLHNPAGIAGIRAAQSAMPGKPMVAVFDTAFHQTMPAKAFIYQIPYKYYGKYKIRKYGFHGTSHRYVANRVAELMGKDIKDVKIVTCHLGQGSSICAIKEGRSVDTSMGLTPLGGIPMVTRSGDLDPSVVLYIMKKENLTAEEMENKLNKESGVMGISGLVPDFRVIESESYGDNERAKVAMECFKSSIAQYVARYAAVMNGVDLVIFTGGVGENQINIRKGICEHLEFLGLDLDAEANEVRSEERLITKPGSKVTAYVIPTNEELMIARETKRLVEGK